MAYVPHEGLKAAIEIVKVGLSSQSIKLQGCSGSAVPDQAKERADIDAAYLDALIKGLVKTLTN